MQTILVPKEASGERLDKYLLPLTGRLSRSELQRDIKTGTVLVNGKVVPPHFFLKGGETIEIGESEGIKLTELKQAAVLIATPKIIEEANDYIVVDKPSGVVVHGAPGLNEATLADWLVKQYPELAGVGEDPIRPGIVHRLDREVSGLMVIARTQTMFDHLKNCFQTRVVKKTYLGLVVGTMKNNSGTIDFPLARSKRNTGKIAARVRPGDDTREAITHYEVIKQYQQVAYLRITIETGRTHQIRAHLAALSHPLVGDKLYRPRTLTYKANPGRVFLHSHELTFTDLAGTEQKFISKLPQELNDFLQKLS